MRIGGSVRVIDEALHVDTVGDEDVRRLALKIMLVVLPRLL